MPTLRVRSNPKRGAVHVEGAAYQFVGAVIDHEASQKTKKIRFSFMDAAQDVPLNAYYRRLVADGDLLAADQETADFCGVKFDVAYHAELDTKAKKAKADAIAEAERAAKEAEKAAKAAAKSAPIDPPKPAA